MKKLVLVVLMLVTSFNANANRMFLDNISCGKYTVLGNVEKERYRNWFLGYLSGENLSSPTDFLVDMDSQGVLGALEKYCSENPLDFFAQGAVFVRNQLQKRTKK